MTTLKDLAGPAPAFVPTVDLADMIADGYRILRRTLKRGTAGQVDRLSDDELTRVRLARADAAQQLRCVSPREPLSVADAIEQLQALRTGTPAKAGV
jgi:hypothetical protein